MREQELQTRIDTLNLSAPLRESIRKHASQLAIESGREAFGKGWKLTDCPYIRENRDGWLLGYGAAAGMIVEAEAATTAAK